MRILPVAVATACLSLGFGAAAKPSEVSFTAKMPDSGNIALGVYSDGKFGQFGRAIDKNTNGGLSHALKVSEFEGKKLSTKVITAPVGSKYKQIMLVGLGDRDGDQTPLDWQEIGGNAVQSAVSAFKSAPPMAYDVPVKALANIAYGSHVGGYYFDEYYTDTESHKSQAEYTFVGTDARQSGRYYNDELASTAKGVQLTRDMSNQPANVVYPEAFVETWKKHFKDMKNIKIKVIDEKQMQKMGMGAIYGVGKGSKRQPRMMIVEYNGGKKGDAPVMFVGKGITFDTGGISLKNPTNMWNMKFDKSGASSVMGATYAIAGRKAKVNLVAIAALAENMPSANAQRPGDIVKSMSGKTIQIRSTDAEGRLVLADGMYYGDTKYNPKVMIDLATLTGSASRALGRDYGALFSRHDDLVAKIEAVGKTSGEKVWHMPLNDGHFEAIKNNVADVMNSSKSGTPGASAGAAFVGEFVRPETYWAHIDIAGVSWGDYTNPMKGSAGSTGYGVRLLSEFVRTYYEK